MTERLIEQIGIGAIVGVLIVAAILVFVAAREGRRSRNGKHNDHQDGSA